VESTGFRFPTSQAASTPCKHGPGEYFAKENVDFAEMAKFSHHFVW